MKIVRVYGWREFVPALIHGANRRGRYRRWPVGVRVSLDRRRGLPLGLHGIQSGWAAVPDSAAGVTTVRVYRTALSLGPVIVTFGSDRTRLAGHPEDIAEWVWLRHQGDIYRLAGHEADRRVERMQRDTRRSLRRVMEESAS